MVWRVTGGHAPHPCHTPIRAQSPQIAKVIPRLAWMLTNRVRPSGLNVDPANSSFDRSAPVLLPVGDGLLLAKKEWTPQD